MMKANFPVRLVGSVVSPEDAKVAAGVAGTEAERLLGRGDFLLVAKGQVIRFQAAYASGSEMAEAVVRIREGGRRRRTWQEAPIPELAPRSAAPALPARGNILEMGNRARALSGGNWAR
jgi:DNA segregation ATPase FtsK/SpoIIIE-like protein